MLTSMTYPPKPKFIHVLKRYPHADPLLIAADYGSFNFIRRRKGVCVLCDQPFFTYDFSCCFNKEAWVLYYRTEHIHRAMYVARQIQFAGARKVIVLLINR